MEAVLKKNLLPNKVGEIQKLGDKLEQLTQGARDDLGRIREEKERFEEANTVIKEFLTTLCMENTREEFNSEEGILQRRILLLEEALNRAQFLARFPKTLDVSFLREETLTYAVGDWTKGERKIPVVVPKYGIFTLDFPFFGIDLINFSYGSLPQSFRWEERLVSCFDRNESIVVPEVLANLVRPSLFSEKEPLLKYEREKKGENYVYHFYSRLITPLPLAPDKKTEERIRELEKEFSKEGGKVFLIAEAPQPWQLIKEETVVPIPPPSCPLIIGVLGEIVLYLGAYSPSKKENYVIAEFVV